MTDPDKPSETLPDVRRKTRPQAQPRDEDQSVVKANEAIAIRPKRGKLTLLSRRIFNVLLFHAQQQGVDKPRYSILLSELIDDARFNSNNTELLKSHLRDMQATTIEWQSTESNGEKKWSSRSLLGAVDITDHGRGQACSITWQYDDAIRERLVRPSRLYTRVLLEISSQMRSYAAAVLYELGARYLTSPGRLTMREDVIWWASVLTGRSDISSVDYRILHRDTIKKALIELDTLCDEFSLELVEHKRSRKVEELQFRVVPKPQAALEGLGQAMAKNVFDLQLVERIVGLGFKRPDAQDLYAVTDEGALRAAVEHVEERMKSTSLPPLKSPAAYLRDALKKRYAGDHDQSEGSVQASVAIQRIAAQPKSQSLGEKLQQLREEWHHQKALDAKSRYAEMDDLDRRIFIGRFETERLPELATPIAKAWRRDGIDSRVAASSFYKWMAGQLWPNEVTDKELLEFAMTRAVE